MRILQSYLLFFICLLLANSATAQLTTSQVRPVDSAYATEWLISPVIHSYNVHSAVGIGPIMTWDAGNGLYPGIATYAVAWSHTDKVSADTAALIDAMNGQAYKSFDLSSMTSVNAYADSVQQWLGSLGIPVGLQSLKIQLPKVFPNPTEGIVHLILPKDFGGLSLQIRDWTGRLIEVRALLQSDHQTLHIFDLSPYPPGVYTIQACCLPAFSIKVIRL